LPITTELCAFVIPDTRHIPFAGAFAVRQLTDKVNAPANAAKCMSAIQFTRRVLSGRIFVLRC